MTIRTHHIEPLEVTADFEFTGDNPNEHEVRDIGATARTHAGVEYSYFRQRVLIDEAKAAPGRLDTPNYDPAIWAQHAVSPLVAMNRFIYWLREHATVECTSKRGKRYFRAQLFSFNASCDADFLFAWHRRLRKQHPEEDLFLPVQPNVICVYQAALRVFYQYPDLPRPQNFQLGTLCNHLGLGFSTNQAHTPLYDARKAAELYRAIEAFEYGDDDQQDQQEAA